MGWTQIKHRREVVICFKVPMEKRVNNSKLKEDVWFVLALPGTMSP